MRHHLVLALFASVCSFACGPSTPWAPPPASVLPVEPRPDELKPIASASVTSTGSVPAAPPPPAPITGELPSIAEAKLVTHAVCRDKQCLLPALYPAGAAAEGGAPAAAWSHDLPDKGTSITFPRHRGVDVMGVVLRGDATITGLEPAAKSTTIGPWIAFRAPGAGLTVSAKKDAVRLALWVVGDGTPIAEVAAALKDPKQKISWTTRPGAIATIDLKSSADLAWAGGAMHARIGFENGRASLGVLMASETAGVAPHTHDDAWEILAPLFADGTSQKATAPGETEMSPIAVTDGMVVAMPKRVRHAWVPGGKKPLVALQMYVPPGPEQRFKALAAAPK